MVFGFHGRYVFMPAVDHRTVGLSIRPESPVGRSSGLKALPHGKAATATATATSPKLDGVSISVASGQCAAEDSKSIPYSLLESEREGQGLFVSQPT